MELIILITITTVVIIFFALKQRRRNYGPEITIITRTESTMIPIDKDSIQHKKEKENIIESSNKVADDFMNYINKLN